jgi:hypothetical protein
MNRYFVWVTLFLSGCMIETRGEQEVGGTVEVIHRVQIEVPQVLLDECNQ